MYKQSNRFGNIAKAILDPTTTLQKPVFQVAGPAVGAGIGYTAAPYITADPDFNITDPTNKKIYENYTLPATGALLFSPKVQKMLWSKKMNDKQTGRAHKAFLQSPGLDEHAIKDIVRRLPDDARKAAIQEINKIPGTFKTLEKIVGHIPHGDAEAMTAYMKNTRIETPIRGMIANLGLVPAATGLASRVDPAYWFAKAFNQKLQDDPDIINPKKQIAGALTWLLASATGTGVNYNDPIAEQYKSMGRQIWDWRNTKDTHINKLKNWVNDKELAAGKGFSQELGAISGGLLGGGAGSLAGRSLVDFLSPRLPYADFKNLSEKDYKKRVAREKRLDRLKTILGFGGSIAGSAAGAGLGIKYLPGIVNKGVEKSTSNLKSQISDVVNAILAPKQASDSTIACFAKVAAADPSDAYYNFIGKPVLGMGVGYLADAAADKLAPHFGIEDTGLTEKQKEAKRKKAMLLGGLWGLGKGTLNQAGAVGLLPDKF